MFKIYNDDNFIINYQDNLEDLVNYFICYYNEHINELLRRFHLDKINKLDIRLFSDKKLLGSVPYKLGDFAGFFNNRGVNCYININGRKGINDIIKAIMHEIVHHIYRFYIEENIEDRITWFDEGLAMNFSLDHEKYNDKDMFICFLNTKILNIKNIPCINHLSHGNNFINDEFNGYDLSYFAVRYLIDSNSEEEFYKIMKSKDKIKNIGVNVLDTAVTFYVDKFNLLYKSMTVK